jgi:Tol biopolymer transport system component/phospholipase C
MVLPRTRSSIRLGLAIATALTLAVTVAGGPSGATGGTSVGVARVAGNGLIAFASDRDGNREIYSMRFDGDEETNLTNDAGDDTAPAWSPDGKRIAFATTRDGNAEIYVMDADGTDQTNLTNHPAPDTSPAWSPDGKRIAFVSTRDGNPEIYAMDADGTDQANLTNDPEPQRDPAWSPDGRRIAFVSTVAGNPDIYVLEVNGTARANLTNSAGTDSEAAWSPDGARIAFTSTRDGNAEVYVMDADGAGVVNLTADPAEDRDPVFSPDGGTRIAFTSNREGDDDIYLMSAVDGADPANISHQAGVDGLGSWQPLVAVVAPASPIRHVVLLYQENQAFDTVLGKLCVDQGRCDGATSGQLPDGSDIPLARAPDIVPIVAHNSYAQKRAVNDGEMNGFAKIEGCQGSGGFACYMQYHQDQIPNLWSLAETYVISDRTFEPDFIPSWQAHIEIVAAELSGFSPNKIPYPNGHGFGPGWGCDSLRDANWRASVDELYSPVPACVPHMDGTGAYSDTPVQWIPTIMDRIDQAGLTWRLYAPGAEEGVSYGWAICPTFASCLYTDQIENVFPPEQFAVDAAAGDLPNLSIIIPLHENSQHNQASMAMGDNWIGDNVAAVMSGPAWSSSAIFITYDDCGCFYDHVPPPEGHGIRIPMVIVSPFARRGHTDSNDASFVSFLAFVERTFRLAPLHVNDATAYGYAESFDFTQAPLPAIRLRRQPIPDRVIEWLKEHPPDPTDPT